MLTKFLQALTGVRIKYHRWQQGKLKRAVDKSLHQISLANSHPVICIEGTFLFVTRVPVGLFQTLEVRNRWTFYADGSVMHEPAAVIGKGFSYKDRRLGQYVIQDGVIVVDLPNNHPSEFRFSVVDQDTLVGYKGTAFGKRKDL